jgi:plastocyanin
MVIAALAFAGYALSGAVSVTLTNTGPQPSRVTVGWGDTLMFVNGDSVPHGITSSRPELNSSTTLSPGQTFTTILTGRTATYPFRQTGGRSLPGAVVSQVLGSLSLKSSATQVTYGNQVTFSGVATIHGTPVSLQRRTRGERGFTELKVLASDPNTGAYSATITPTIGANYRTTIAGGQIISLLREVDVMPRLTISAPAKKTKTGHRVDIYTRVTPARAAALVTLIQCTASRGAEEQVGRKAPGAGGGAKFSWQAEQGKTVLRAVISHHDSAVGYLSPESKKIAIVGVGKPAPKPKHRHRPRIKSC